MNSKWTKKDLRSCGFGLTIASIVIGTHFLKGNYTAYFSIIAFALAIFTSALFFPFLLRPFLYVLRPLGHFLGLALTNFVLICVYYLVLTPIGILTKVFNKNFLDLDIDKGVNTYWIKKEKQEPTKQRYQKQY